jgi:hypothetical protein
MNGLGVRIVCELRPVRRCHDLDDAGMALGGGDIEGRHAPARDATHRQHGVKHFGRVIVGGVACGARHLQHAVAAGQRLADA